MKRSNVKILPHARLRLNERLSKCVSKSDVLNALKNGDVHFAKRETNTRSIVYGEVDGEPFKCVFSRKENLVVTFLPINYEYCTNFCMVSYKGKIYRIKLYPDCFIECSNPRTLTKFEMKNGDKWESCRKVHPFEKLYRIVWRMYLNGGFNGKEVETTKEKSNGSKA